MDPFVRRACLSQTILLLEPAVSVWERPTFFQTSRHMSDTALSVACDCLTVIVSGYPRPWDT